MAENVIFETIEIDGFVYFSSYSAFMRSVAPSPFELIEGQEYKIIWDNEEYIRVAFAFTNPADNTSCIAVGNKMVATGENDGDLFAIVNDTTNNYTHLFSLENKTSHSVGIYQVVEEGVLLTNNRGKDVAYFGVENILVRTTEDGVTQSGQQIFTKGEAIEGVEINLALADGDQTIKAPEGKLVKSAIIKKPDTLIPENIVKDIVIAGVTGTSEGGGGGGGFVSKKGTEVFFANIPYTISHNLGVVPDIFFIWTGNISITNDGIDPYLISAFGMSEAFHSKVGGSFKKQAVYGKGTTNGITSTYWLSGIESEAGVLSNATEKSITVGNTDHPIKAGTYYWLAIGGLT